MDEELVRELKPSEVRVDEATWVIGFIRLSQSEAAPQGEMIP